MKAPRNVRKRRESMGAPVAIFTIFLLVICGAYPARTQQKLSSFDRDRGRQMLDIIKDDIKKNYYDPAFHGIDLDTHFKRLTKRSNKQPRWARCLALSRKH